MAATSVAAKTDNKKISEAGMPEATLVQFSTPQLVTADIPDFKPPKVSGGFLTNNDKTGLKKKVSLVKSAKPQTKQCPPGKKSVSNDQDILNMISAPRVWTLNMKQWRQMVSSVPATRTDVVELKRKTEAMLKSKSAHKTGLCLIRRGVYRQVFDELIRHITVNCAERGLILIHVRDDIRQLLGHFERIYFSAIAYGIRKKLQALQEQDRLIERIKAVQHEVDQERRIYDELLPHYKRFAEQYAKTSEDLEKEFQEEYEKLLKRKNQLKLLVEQSVGPRKNPQRPAGKKSRLLEKLTHIS